MVDGQAGPCMGGAWRCAWYVHGWMHGGGGGGVVIMWWWDNCIHHHHASMLIPCTNRQQIRPLLTYRHWDYMILLLSFYTGRLWYHRCSCQSTVGLTILSLHKVVCFYCTKSLFYSLPVYKDFPATINSNGKLLTTIFYF